MYIYIFIKDLLKFQIFNKANIFPGSIFPLFSSRLPNCSGHRSSVAIQRENSNSFTLFPLGKSNFQRPLAAHVLGWPFRATRDLGQPLAAKVSFFLTEKDLIFPSKWQQCPHPCGPRPSDTIMSLLLLLLPIFPMLDSV